VNGRKKAQETQNHAFRIFGGFAKLARVRRLKIDTLPSILRALRLFAAISTADFGFNRGGSLLEMAKQKRAKHETAHT
jgi:hypothetical protein